MYNNKRGNHPIDPLLLAAKIESVRNFECELVRLQIEKEPRFVEMLWFLQWASNYANYAGGIARLAFTLLEDFEDSIGTDTMLKLGKRPSYTGEEEQAIRSEIPDALVYLDDDTAKPARPHGHKHYLAFCKKHAEEGLAEYLFALCEKPGVMFTRPGSASTPYPMGWGSDCPPWYFSRVCYIILEFMDRHKAQRRAEIAETQITRDIHGWLEFAREGNPTMISGTERFGKTEAIKNWAVQNPGLARIVKTPSSNDLTSLHLDVAKALGFKRDAGDSGYALAEKIDYVLAHSSLMLIFDECHWLMPVKFSKTTVPHRMNWVRGNLIDSGIPCAFIATPQAYKKARDKFISKTDYAIGQWDERIYKFDLAAELADEDLLAVARIQFKALDNDALEYIVSLTRATERNYVSDISKIATLAFFNARRAGRAKPSLDDLDNAIARVLPAIASDSKGARTAEASSARIASKAKASKPKRQNPLSATPACPISFPAPKDRFSNSEQQPLVQMAG